MNGERAGPAPRATLRRRAYLLLEGDEGGRPVARALRYGLVTLVVANVGLAFLTARLAPGDPAWTFLLAFELLTLAVFTVEYAARVWVSVEDPRYARLGPLAARLAYARSPEAIVDLVAVLPMYAVVILGADLRGLLLLRVLRLLKLFRYSGGMAALADAVAAERRSLSACAIILATVVALSASAIHYAERAAQPDVFGTLEDAFWWSIVTITTVGYGDTVPVTGLGRAIAAMTMVVGFAFIALPIAILSSSFADVIRNRDFQVTWALVGEVPFLAALDAATISRWMPRLIARRFERGDVVVPAGEEPVEFHMVVAGTLEGGSAEAGDDAPVRLGEGAVFGGPVPLANLGIEGPVLALSDVRVMLVSADDIALIRRHRPDLVERMRASASRGRAPPAGAVGRDRGHKVDEA